MKENGLFSMVVSTRDDGRAPSLAWVYMDYTSCRHQRRENLGFLISARFGAERDRGGVRLEIC